MNPDDRTERTGARQTPDPSRAPELEAPERGERVAKGVFVVSLIALSVLYGTFAGQRAWFPSPQLRAGVDAWDNLRKNWQNDFAMKPTRHIVPAIDPDPARPAWVAHRPDEVEPGDVLIGGLTPERETLQGVTLYGADGEELHHWALDYKEYVPDGVGEYNVLLHGVQPFPDGSVVVAFDAGEALARVDACGGTMWVAEGGYHHAVSRDADGSLWAWRGEGIAHLDADTGEILDEINFKEDVLEANDMYGQLAVRSSEDTGAKSFRFFDDAFHFNDVEPLLPEMAAAFPQFEAGDLLISLREINMVAVLRPGTRRILWSHVGPWFKQHDPDFEPDGRISVYDNRMGLEHSEILAIDPKTNEVEVLFTDSPETPFYSWRRGKHQILDDGNILITESERGRVFEVDPDGRLVWERNMRFDDTHNSLVTSAEYLAPGFFDEGALDCPPPAASAASDDAAGLASADVRPLNRMK